MLWNSLLWALGPLTWLLLFFLLACASVQVTHPDGTVAKLSATADSSASYCTLPTDPDGEPVCWVAESSGISDNFAMLIPDTLRAVLQAIGGLLSGAGSGLTPAPPPSSPAAP